MPWVTRIRPSTTFGRARQGSNPWPRGPSAALRRQRAGVDATVDGGTTPGLRYVFASANEVLLECHSGLIGPHARCPVGLFTTCNSFSVKRTLTAAAELKLVDRRLVDLDRPITQHAEYQVHLIEDCKLAPSSVSIAVSALRFLYKVTLKRPWAPDEIPMPKKAFKLPVILSPEEVVHFLESVHSMKHRAILMAAYAAGLRVSEATHLKVTDIDSQRMMLRVDQGKGGKDRYVTLSPRLLEELRSYWRARRP